jgi:hypothetical protein
VAEDLFMRHSLHQRGLQILLLVALPWAGPACHHTAGQATRPPAPDDSNADIPLEVANHNWLDVIIYVVRDGQPVRIGIASASSSASFTLPARLLSQGREIRLWGHPIGGTGGTLTETVVVQPGQWVEWTLESDLDRSAIGVY